MKTQPQPAGNQNSFFVCLTPYATLQSDFICCSFTLSELRALYMYHDKLLLYNTLYKIKQVILMGCWAAR